MGQKPYRCGFVALLGRANVGKSTLTNCLVGDRIAITSPKPQTTRKRVLGLIQSENSQVILVDTPGLTTTSAPLPKALTKIARTAAAEADVVAVVVAVHNGQPSLSPEDEAVLQAARHTNATRLVVLNKIDLLRDKRSLLPWMAAWSSAHASEVVVPVSARKGDGIDALLATLTGLLPEGPALYPKDVHTDQTERSLCAELIREQLLWRLEREVPHSAAVVLEEFVDERDTERPICRMHARIVVEREGQKAIVIGHRGETLKLIGTMARERMERLLGSKVFLRLHVAVDSKWTTRPQALSQYDIGEPVS